MPKTNTDAASKAPTAPAERKAAGKQQRGEKTPSAHRTRRGSKGRGRSKADGAKMRVIPLGGLDAIGKNMTAFECGDDIILVDAGLMFPDDEHVGVDLILPDYTYLLENAQKLSGDDGKAILAAASRTGILPGLMTKDEAEAFTSMSRYPRVIENYQDWLDDHENGDEYVSGDTTMSYGQVKKRVRQLTAELEELKDEYGGRQKELRQKVRKIFELGMKAYRKGEGAGDEGKKDPKKKAKQKPSAHPHGKKPIAGKGGKKKNWGEVDGNDAFVRMIASQSEGE